MENLFSENLRLMAIKEVREMHKTKLELDKAYKEKVVELVEIIRRLSGLKDKIKASCDFFGFEYRDIRDSDGHLVPDETGGYKKDYFFKEEEGS